MVRPGVKNSEITRVIDLVAQEYGVQLVEGVLSHSMEQYIIDGDKVIIQAPKQDQKVEEFAIEENSVFTIDVLMTTGQGKVYSLAFACVAALLQSG